MSQVMPHLDRNPFIALLKRLESPDEKDVLAAAREIAGRMKEAGVSWDDLLAMSEPVPAEAIEPATQEGGADKLLSADETEEAHAEIVALLALKGISKATRGDINDLRGDLAEGRFGKADLRYVRALRARLS